MWHTFLRNKSHNNKKLRFVKVLKNIIIDTIKDYKPLLLLLLLLLSRLLM